MEEILALLKSNPREAVSKMAERTLSRTKIDNLRREYYELDRKVRPNQVGFIQQDKLVGPKGRKYIQKAVKIPMAFQNKIVNTSTAFEVGESVTLIPYITSSKVKENQITEEIKRLWKVNRIDSVLQKVITLKKAELQCAIMFYIKDIEKQSLINRLLGINPKRDIKIDVLQNKNGTMTPFFDDFGDMVGFMWQFSTIKEGKSYNHAWIFTDTDYYKISDETTDGKMEIYSSGKHGFSKIPIVYFSQEYPEWHVTHELIDRFEVALSKLGASNDYSGHPILMLYGEVAGAPSKDEDGKVLRFNIKEDDDTGKIKHGDAAFLTHDNAPQSVKLELERLEKFIYSISSTPDLSLENLKGIGDISGKAIRLMFMDAIIKSKMNEGENRTSIERIISVFMSGIVTTIATNLKPEAESTYFDVKFNSILPNDLTEDILTYVQAVKAGIMSARQAISTIGIAEDVDHELAEIQKDMEERLEREEKFKIRANTTNVKAGLKPTLNDVKD